MNRFIRSICVGATLAAAPAWAHAQAYVLETHAITSGGGRSAGGSHELAGTIGQAPVYQTAAGGSYILRGGFQARCPADFNDDCLINSQDFFAYIACFFGQCQGCDFNADGRCDSQDFFDFLAAFFAGCG